MKQKKRLATVTFLLLGLGGLQAQESPTVAGGEATGTGGTSSYSVGQVVYTTATGTNGSLAQGVQQLYEISINLELSVYPNPVINYLTLKTDDNSNLSYQLYDLQGRVIENKKVSNNTTNINLEEQPTATYFLNVIKVNQVVKTFKIIKN